MAEGEGSKGPEVRGSTITRNGELKDGTTATTAGREDDMEEQEQEQEDDEDDGNDDEEEEEEEPRLKYVSVTKRLSSLYRNGDAVSAFLVAGDKMVRDRIPTVSLQADIPLTGSADRRKSQWQYCIGTPPKSCLTCL